MLQLRTGDCVGGIKIFPSEREKPVLKGPVIAVGFSLNGCVISEKGAAFVLPALACEKPEVAQ